ncbi:hypothetical protein FACS189472_05410 [Alphaproteobacteria bacterium]|nr:hypothetical protein FACS189472_05410 [Alphaproteobacteria bacterium]
MFAGRLTEIAEYAKTAWLHASRTGQPVPPCDLVTLVGGSWKETPVGINKMLDELQKIRPWLLKFACVQTGNPDLLDAYLQTRE